MKIDLHTFFRQVSGRFLQGKSGLFVPQVPVVLLVACSIFVATVGGTVVLHSTKAVAAPLDTHASLQAATTRLLQLASTVAKSPAHERGAAIEALSAVVEKRQAALLSEAKKNPHTFLLTALPQDVIANLPTEVQPLLEQWVSVEGDMEVRYIDPAPNADTASDGFIEYELTVTNPGTKKRYTVHFDGDVPPGLVTGTKVTVRGVALNDTLVTTGYAQGGDATTGATILSQPAESISAVPQKTIVILVNFTNSTSQPWTIEQITETVFTGASSSNAFHQENSFGEVSFEGDVVGWYTLPITNENCDTSYTQVAQYADQAASSAGVRLNDYSRKIYVYNSSSGCSWGGLGTIGGSPSRAWIFGYNSAPYIAHELGHNLGNQHAQGMLCGTKSIDVKENCTYSPYGDTSDVMGNATSYFPHFNGPHKIGQGWFNQTDHVQTVTTSGTYTITPLETNDPTPKVLKIERPGNTEALYISYRMPLGFDAKLPFYWSNGVSIHLWTGSQSYYTRLLDMTPGDGTFVNAPLRDDASFVDAASGITVKQISHVVSSSATVEVTFSTPVCPRATPTVTISPLTHSGAPGVTKTYTMSVVNNDSTSCPATTFTLSGVAPTGWGASVSPTAVTVAAGATASATLSVTPPVGTSDGSYTVTAHADNASVIEHAGQASATYVSVVPPPDTTKPVVSISAPRNNATVQRNKTTTITATAQDAVGVTKVEFYVSSVLMCTDTVAPYTCAWAVPSGANITYALVAKAFDAAQNVGVSATTTVKSK